MLEWDDDSNPGSLGSLICNIEGKVMAVFLSGFVFKMNQFIFTIDSFDFVLFRFVLFLV